MTILGLGLSFDDCYLYWFIISDTRDKKYYAMENFTGLCIISMVIPGFIFGKYLLPKKPPISKSKPKNILHFCISCPLAS